MRHSNKWMSLLLLLAPALHGQTTTESLRIASGDTLHVIVFDTPQLEEHVRVTDSGEIPLVLGGTVRVASLTVQEAARSIEKTLIDSNILIAPRVLVTLEDSGTQKVYVLGEVKTPGSYAIQTPRSILDVLSLAGGITDTADRKLLIERRSGSEKVSYFLSNSPDVAMDTAVKVNPGDTIVVPKAGIVYLLGDVGHPGGYTMTDNHGQITLLELISRAGSTNHTAVPSHARLIRKTGDTYTDTQIPLSAIQKGKKPDMPLQADDIIYVPFSYLRNFAVNAAGIVSSVGSAAVYRF